MNIVVFVKMVSSNIVGDKNEIFDKIDINPYDKFAIEQAVEIKKRIKENCKITCICMGSKMVKDKIKDCILIGADNVILLSDDKFAGADTIATSYVLWKAIKYICEYDLILCGNKSVDGETGQVGPSVATRLNIPSITNVVRIEEVNNEEIICLRETEKQSICIKCKLPMLITFKDFSTSVIPNSLGAIKKARHSKVNIITSNNLLLNNNFCGAKGSKTTVISSDKIDVIPKGISIINGSVEKKVESILELLK